MRSLRSCEAAGPAWHPNLPYLTGGLKPSQASEDLSPLENLHGLWWPLPQEQGLTLIFSLTFSPPLKPTLIVRIHIFWSWSSSLPKGAGRNQDRPDESSDFSSPALILLRSCPSVTAEDEPLTCGLGPAVYQWVCWGVIIKLLLQLHVCLSEVLLLRAPSSLKASPL